MKYKNAVFAIEITRSSDNTNGPSDGSSSLTRPAAAAGFELTFHPEKSGEIPSSPANEYRSGGVDEDGEQLDTVTRRVMKSWLLQTFRYWKSCRESTPQQRDRLVANYTDMFYTDHQQHQQVVKAVAATSTSSLPTSSSTSSSSSAAAATAAAAGAIPASLLPPPVTQELNATVLKLFRLESDALDQLRSFDHGFCGEFIDLARKSGLELMIGGSAGIAATRQSADFTPNDIDLYLKEITNDKIRTLDTIIHELKPSPAQSPKVPPADKYKIVMIRKPLTLTWLLTTNLKIQHRIQLCLMKIGSWADVFSVYHSDIVSTGFDIATNHFVVFYPRWRRLFHALTRYDPPPHDEPDAPGDFQLNPPTTPSANAAAAEGDASMTDIDSGSTTRVANKRKESPTAASEEQDEEEVEEEETTAAAASAGTDTDKSKKTNNKSKKKKKKKTKIERATAAVASDVLQSTKHVCFSDRYSGSTWYRRERPIDSKMNLVYLSNFLNLDTGLTLYSAGEKYDDRGFHLDLIKAKDPDVQEKDLPLSEEISLSSPLWDLEEVFSSYHPLQEEDLVAPLVKLQRSSLYKLATQISELLIDETRVPVPEILDMRWIGTTLTAANAFLTEDPVGSHSHSQVAHSLLAPLPWQIGEKYRGRYGATFITAPLILAMEDLILQNAFQGTKNFFFRNAKPARPTRRERMDGEDSTASSSSSSSDTIPPSIGADKYCVKVKFVVPPRRGDHRRYVPAHIKFVENSYRFTYWDEDNDDEDEDEDEGEEEENEEGNEEENKGEKVKEDEEDEAADESNLGVISSIYRTKGGLKTQVVQCGMLYNTAQITRVLIDLGHITHDSTDERWPWMVWYFHSLWNQYRLDSIATLKSAGDHHMVPDLVGVVVEYM